MLASCAPVTNLLFCVKTISKTSIFDGFFGRISIKINHFLNYFSSKMKKGFISCVFCCTGPESTVKAPRYGTIKTKENKKEYVIFRNQEFPICLKKKFLNSISQYVCWNCLKKNAKEYEEMRLKDKEKKEKTEKEKFIDEHSYFIVNRRKLIKLFDSLNDGCSSCEGFERLYYDSYEVIAGAAVRLNFICKKCRRIHYFNLFEYVDEKNPSQSQQKINLNLASTILLSGNYYTDISTLFSYLRIPFLSIDQQKKFCPQFCDLLIKDHEIIKKKYLDLMNEVAKLMGIGIDLSFDSQWAREMRKGVGRADMASTSFFAMLGRELGLLIRQEISGKEEMFDYKKVDGSKKKKKEAKHHDKSGKPILCIEKYTRDCGLEAIGNGVDVVNSLNSDSCASSEKSKRDFKKNFEKHKNVIIEKDTWHCLNEPLKLFKTARTRKLGFVGELQCKNCGKVWYKKKFKCTKDEGCGNYSFKEVLEQPKYPNFFRFSNKLIIEWWKEICDVEDEERKKKLWKSLPKYIEISKGIVFCSRELKVFKKFYKETVDDLEFSVVPSNDSGIVERFHARKNAFHRKGRKEGLKQYKGRCIIAELDFNETTIAKIDGHLDLRNTLDNNSYGKERYYASFYKNKFVESFKKQKTEKKRGRLENNYFDYSQIRKSVLKFMKEKKEKSTIRKSNVYEEISKWIDENINEEEKKEKRQRKKRKKKMEKKEKEGKKKKKRKKKKRKKE